MYVYGSIFLTIIVSLVISSLLVIASYVLAIQKVDIEKSSIYECGFDPYGDARQPFQVQFFLVGILYLIFDLEITYLFPWCIALKSLSLEGFTTMCFFLFILTLGLVYEWLKGGLEWQ